MKQPNIFLRAKTLGVAGLSLFLSGCLTPALWKESDLVDHFKPASDARVQLFAKPDHTGVLVLYDETHEERDSVRRRAFFLKPNEIKLQERERPQFTNPAAAAKLQPVPLIGHDATGTNAPPDQLQVRLSEDGHRFTLLERGEERGAYDLPVYPSRGTTAVRVLLTPLAVAGDAALVGSVVGLIWLCYGHATL